MILYCIGHRFHYEMENLLRLFLPDEKILVRQELVGEPKIPYALTFIGDEVLSAWLDTGGKATEKTLPLKSDCPPDEAERLLASALFELLCNRFGYRPPWGILTGVRPTKLMTALKNEYGAKKALKVFTDDLFVSLEKGALALEVAAAEEKILTLSKPESFSLYIAIPFCPTRCGYCSFVSHSVTSPALKKSVPAYVGLLCEELSVLGKLSKELSLNLESVYWGGGTPTTLDPPQLERIFEAVEQSFDLSAAREYTVEAGRPDTVTAERLSVLKAHGVTRISINPQSFSDEVLSAIGRRHTAEDTVRAFHLARSYGFDNINADLIAALPDDTPEGFENSVKTAIEMGFESVTVHTLARKRSSALVTEKQALSQTAAVSETMLKSAGTLLRQAGYAPYYMYRQSKSVGNLENTGWSKPQHECLYNVFMMEECHSVLAAGAGAVTKLKAPRGPYIERLYNFKYPYEYIARFSEILERKNKIAAFYQTDGNHLKCEPQVPII